MLRNIAILLLLVSLPAGFIAADGGADLDDENPGLMLRAFMISYPGRISEVNYDPEADDWYMVAGSTRLYWAKGRLLPADKLQDWSKWRPYIDYYYPEKVPDPDGFSEDLIKELKSQTLAESRSNSPTYNIAFYDILYDGRTRRRIESHITRFDYLGKRVSVHTSIVAPLKRVEKAIMKLAAADKEVRSFVDSIGSIEGYNWREIADSPSRSNHSWGIAVDILPVNWGKKNIYWNWISYWNDDWMLIDPDRRWSPPRKVIEIFESEGFIWGGKWYLWDTMHFEYRPELLLLQKWGYKKGNH